MKTALLLILVSSLTSSVLQAQTPAPFVIVSDIDDTIKITDVLKKSKAVENGLFGRRTFVGMAELYQELTKSAAAAAQSQAPDPAVVYMSGSPPFLKHEVSNMLIGEHKFPPGEFIMRPKLTDDIYKFKSEHFAVLAAANPLPFLALGDDTEKDPEVLHDFAATQPASKVTALYIHRVTGRAIPPGLTEFHTAFDIALNEFEAGRLTAEQAVRVGNVILAANRPDTLFPKYTECPKDFTYADTPKVCQSPELLGLRNDVASYVRAYCAVRGTKRRFVPPPRGGALASALDTVKRGADSLGGGSLGGSAPKCEPRGAQ